MQLININVALLNKLIVSLYKTVGFGILSAILLGLVGYIGLNIFFFVNHSWITPTIISRADERVLALSAQEAEQATQRDKLIAQRNELLGQIEEDDRVIAADEAFQASFRQAVKMDLAARWSELEKLNGLKVQYVRSKDEIQRESRKYANVSNQQARELYEAHLLDEDEYTAANYHRAQILHTNLSLEENQVALDNRIAEVQRDINSLKLIQTALENGTPLPPNGDLSYQALHIKEDDTHSITELANARNTRDVHVQNLSSLNGSIDRYDRILKEIQNSPYLKAVDENLNIAFVPYDNVRGVHPDVSVYECRLGLVFCRTGREGSRNA